MSSLTGFSVPAAGAEGFPATAVPDDAVDGRVTLRFKECTADELALLARRLRKPHWTALRAVLVEAAPDPTTTASKKVARALCLLDGARALRAVAAAAVAADDGAAAPGSGSKLQSLRDALGDVEDMIANFDAGDRAAYRSGELPTALKAVLTFDGNADGEDDGDPNGEGDGNDDADWVAALKGVTYTPQTATRDAATIAAALTRAATAGRGDVRRALHMLGATPDDAGASDDDALRTACIAALSNSLQRAARAAPRPARRGSPCPRCSAANLSNVDGYATTAAHAAGFCQICNSSGDDHFKDVDVATAEKLRLKVLWLGKSIPAPPKACGKCGKSVGSNAAIDSSAGKFYMCTACKVDFHNEYHIPDTDNCFAAVAASWIKKPAGRGDSAGRPPKRRRLDASTMPPDPEAFRCICTIVDGANCDDPQYCVPNLCTFHLNMCISNVPHVRACEDGKIVTLKQGDEGYLLRASSLYLRGLTAAKQREQTAKGDGKGYGKGNGKGGGGPDASSGGLIDMLGGPTYSKLFDPSATASNSTLPSAAATPGFMGDLLVENVFCSRAAVDGSLFASTYDQDASQVKAEQTLLQSALFQLGPCGRPVDFVSDNGMAVNFFIGNKLMNKAHANASTMSGGDARRVHRHATAVTTELLCRDTARRLDDLHDALADAVQMPAAAQRALDNVRANLRQGVVFARYQQHRMHAFFKHNSMAPIMEAEAIPVTPTLTTGSTAQSVGDSVRAAAVARNKRAADAVAKLSAKKDRKDGDTAITKLCTQVGRLIGTTEKVNKSLLAAKRRNPRGQQGTPKKQRTTAAADADKDTPGRAGSRGRGKKRSDGNKHCDHCFEKNEMCYGNPEIGKWTTHNTAQCNSKKKSQ